MKNLSKALSESGSELTHKNTFLIDGYVGEGYSLATETELQTYIRIAREEGILLDPCYTGKAFIGMLNEIKNQPDRFGEKILFLHSGGGFGNFAYAEQYQKVLAERS